MDFSQKILVWYAENKRQLPWRKTNDPYKIWLSEVMLQQTRIAQGLPYYEKFVKEFPSVFELATADEQKVLKLWQGLGYYSRARNMHATAKTIVEKYDGSFPKTYKELIKLKGVGDYTASAIASICFDEPEPVVDGNVYRVLSRFFGVKTPINSTEGSKYFKKLAREVMAIEGVRDYNQGIMEFGAMQCTPQNPNCEICPINKSCKALQEGRVSKLPVKLKKLKIKKKNFNYLVILDAECKSQFHKRIEKGIWQNLYQFPLLETKEELHSFEEVDRDEFPFSIADIQFKATLYNDKPVVHKLSHQHLYTKFWILETTEVLKDGIPFEKLKDYPMPVLIDNFIRTFKF